MVQSTFNSARSISKQAIAKTASRVAEEILKDPLGSSGYDVLDRNSEDTFHAGGAANSTTAVVGATKTNERSILIACKTK